MKKTTFFIFLHLFFLFLACSRPENNKNPITLSDIFPVQEKIDICTEAEQAMIRAADKGNYQPIWDYLANGGDPMLQCRDRTRPMNYTYSLYIPIMLSDSLELIKYYLSFELSQYVIDQMLMHIIIDENSNDELITLLVDKGAHYFDENFFYPCYKENIKVYQKLARNGYDFNWRNPSLGGETVLMTLAQCPVNLPDYDNVDKILEIIKFLVDNGAKTDVKNDQGKTILEVAENEKIIEYFKSIQK
jgi:hypothetical protein